MNTTGKKGYWPIVQELRPGPNDGEEPEITASGLTHSWRSFKGEPNALRVGTVYTDLHYGLLVIDWHASPVTVELQLRDRHNEVQRREILRLPALSPSPSR